MFFFFFFHWHYSPLWALACRTMSFHFFLSATNSLHLLTPSTWRSLSTSSFHLFLGLTFLLVPSSSRVKIFLGILSSSILSRWPNQLIICPFIHFTIFSPLLTSSSSRIVRKSVYIILNIHPQFHRQSKPIGQSCLLEKNILNTNKLSQKISVLLPLKQALGYMLCPKNYCCLKGKSISTRVSRKMWLRWVTQTKIKCS